MVTILDDNGIRNEAERLIEEAKDHIVIISPCAYLGSPYLDLLNRKYSENIRIIFICGNQSTDDDFKEWASSMTGLTLLHLSEIHSKALISEDRILLFFNDPSDDLEESLEIGILIDRDDRIEYRKSINLIADKLERIKSRYDIGSMTEIVETIRLGIDGDDVLPVDCKTFERRCCIRCGQELRNADCVFYCNQCSSELKSSKSISSTFKDGHCWMCGRPNESSIRNPCCISCYHQETDTILEAMERTKKLFE